MAGDDEQQQQRSMVLLAGAAALVVVALSVLLHISTQKKKSKLRKFPRTPPGAWPIVGHLTLFVKDRPHQVLADLCMHHGFGPIMGLRLGAHQAVVVSSAAAAKDLLSTHDKAFANRVHYAFADHVFYGYNTALGFSSYNPRWSFMRKLYTLELFTAKRLQDFAHFRHEELRKLLHRLLQASMGGAAAQAVDLRGCLFDMSGDTAARQFYSKTLSESAPELPELIRDMEDETFPTVGDYIPWLRFLDVFPKRRMNHLHRRLDKVFSSVVKERRRLMATCPANQLPNDFLQVIMSKDQTGNVGEQIITDDDVKAVMLDIFSGSIHTSSVTVEWALAHLLCNPERLLKLRDEVDLVSKDKKGILTDEDVQKMPYLENVVKETLRLQPVGPLLLPRVSSADCQVGEYTLLKGTQAFVNVWAIARDPHTWDKPNCFYPERFEGKDLDLRGQHYDLLPFGAGRRMCPGMRMGMSVVQLTLANLVKFFEWELPDGESASTLNMNEKAYRGVSKETPLLAIPKIRQYCIPPI